MYDVIIICENFNLVGDIIDYIPYGEGHICDTYKITTNYNDKITHYLFQRINDKVFHNVDKLMQNIELVTSFCKEKIIQLNKNPDRNCLSIIKTKDNNNFYHNEDGYFRIYNFIEDATTIQTITNKNDFYSIAVAFGNFAKMLSDFDATKLYEVIPNFHNTKLRYKNLLNAIELNPKNRVDEITKEIEFAKKISNICGTITDKIDSDEIPIRVTHNDTKINNVMLDAKTRKGLAVIDLDTVMAGSLCYDFGDSIRSGCLLCPEDETDIDKVEFRLDLYEVFLKGYLSEVNNFITQNEKELLAMGAILMTYEVGIRFLTDYIEGDTYFKIQHEKHNLDRARVQLKLVEKMLNSYDKMQALIKSY